MLTTRHTLDAQGRTQRIEQIVYVNDKAQKARLIERQEHADIEKGEVLRKGWCIHPKTGQKVETDF